MENWWWLISIAVLFWILREDKKETNQHIEARIRKKEGDTQMQELAKRFLGKDVLINTISLGNIDGILEEVQDNAIILKKDEKESVVNLDYVIRLREYPKDKNGKRKSIITD